MWNALWQALLVQAPHHAWPGNVRELDNLIERLVVCVPSDGAWAEQGAAKASSGASGAAAAQWLRQLAPELFAKAPSTVVDGPTAADEQALKPAQRHSERGHIEATLAACGGDKAAACERLGISRTTLWRKLKASASSPVR